MLKVKDIKKLRKSTATETAGDNSGEWDLPTKRTPCDNDPKNVVYHRVY